MPALQTQSKGGRRDLTAEVRLFTRSLFGDLFEVYTPGSLLQLNTVKLESRLEARASSCNSGRARTMTKYVTMLSGAYFHMLSLMQVVEFYTVCSVAGAHEGRLDKRGKNGGNNSASSDR